MRTVYYNSEVFNNLEDFISTISTRSTNYSFRNYRNTLASTDSKVSFRGTATWEEAQELLAKGYEEGLKMILEDNAGIDLHSQRSRIIRKVDFVGQRPHIVNTIMGRPKTMVHRIKNNVEVKTLTIYFNNFTNSNVPTSHMIRAGRNFLALIMFLERNNYRVEIKLVAPTIIKSQQKNYIYEGILPIIKVKDFKQPLNPLILSYPLVHPSFDRRHFRRYIETYSFTDKEEWTSGYGYASCDTLGSDEFRNALIENNLMDNKSSFFLNWDECKNANEIDDMLTSMKFNK